MKQFVYAMRATDPAPAGADSTGGWFFFYKWEPGEITFVPFPEGSLPHHPPILPERGDLLWFFMDGRCLGCVPVRESKRDLNQDVEVWYSTDDISRTPYGGGCGSEWGLEVIATGLVFGGVWLAALERMRLQLSALERKEPA